jgi:hypothetical protein
MNAQVARSRNVIVVIVRETLKFGLIFGHGWPARPRAHHPSARAATRDTPRSATNN